MDEIRVAEAVFRVIRERKTGRCRSNAVRQR